MKKKSLVFLILLALLLTLTACAKSEFGLSENTEKRMTISAANAAKDAFFQLGSLEVDEGEQIVISSNLTKGSVRVEILAAPTQSINELPATDGAAIITANATGTEGFSGTVPKGSYFLKATCLEPATGTVSIEVTPAA